MMVDLQVAEIPWTTSAGGLEIEGYRTGPNVSNMITLSFTCCGILKPRRLLTWRRLASCRA